MVESVYTISTFHWSEWIPFTSYIVLGIFGVIGNVFVIYVINKNGMKSTTFKLVSNQAISDMSCGVLYLCVWLGCSSKVLSLGSIGILTCEGIYTLKVTMFFVSVFTMMFISIERYLKLYHPYSEAFKPMRIIPIIWFLGLITAVICMFHFRTAEFFTKDRLLGCRLTYNIDSNIFKKHYNFLLLIVVGFTIPVSVTAFMYYKVIIKIKNRNALKALTHESIQKDGHKRIVPNFRLSYGHHQSNQTRKRSRTTQMLIATIIAYVTLCSPLYIVFTINYFMIEILPSQCNSYTREPWWFLVTYFICVVSICINPFIYCWFNEEFKIEAYTILSSIFCSKRCGLRSAELSLVTQNQASDTNRSFLPNDASI